MSRVCNCDFCGNITSCYTIKSKSFKLEMDVCRICFYEITNEVLSEMIKEELNPKR